jgi:hypothetical protein
MVMVPPLLFAIESVVACLHYAAHKHDVVAGRDYVEPFAIASEHCGSSDVITTTFFRVRHVFS